MSTNIKRDLDELLAQKVITPQVQQDINAYYANKKAEQPNKLFAIFGVLGSLLIGLGVISILAHNWDDFSKTTKSIWAFIPLVMGQLLAGYTLWKNKSSAWKETGATFLYFAIGASMALISQIYNMSGEMSTFLLTWILLGLPLIYVLRSYSVTLLHLLFATIYACNAGYFNDQTHWMYLLLLVAILPVYIRKIKAEPTANSTTMLHWLVPLSIIISLGSFVEGDNFIGFVICILVASVFYNIGKLPHFKNARKRSNGYLVLGSFGTVFTLLCLSFKLIWEEFEVHRYTQHDFIMALVLGIIVLVLLMYSVRKTPLRKLDLFQFTGLLFSGIFMFHTESILVSVGLTNLLLLSLGISVVRLGAKRNLYSVLNYGLLIITAIIACRFFDTSILFKIRGVLFVLIGIGFFGANFYMYKKAESITLSETNTNLKNIDDE